MILEKYTITAKKQDFSNSYIEKIGKKFIEDKEGIKLYKIHPGKNYGIPDYFYEEGYNYKFIEFKNMRDGLNFHQLNWIENHKDCIIRVIFIEIKDKNKQLEE